MTTLWFIRRISRLREFGEVLKSVRLFSIHFYFLSRHFIVFIKNLWVIGENLHRRNLEIKSRDLENGTLKKVSIFPRPINIYRPLIQQSCIKKIMLSKGIRVFVRQKLYTFHLRTIIINCVCFSLTWNSNFEKKLGETKVVNFGFNLERSWQAFV